MTVKAAGRTATCDPIYGMRPVGGFGVRGWRAHCPDCGFLSAVYTNIRGGQRVAQVHRCAS